MRVIIFIGGFSVTQKLLANLVDVLIKETVENDGISVVGSGTQPLVRFILICRLLLRFLFTRLVEGEAELIRSY